MSVEDERDPLLAALEDDDESLGANTTADATAPVDPEREKALDGFKRKLKEHREWDAKLKEMRLTIKDLDKEYEKTEDDLKALQSLGQIIGEVLKQLDEERFIVKSSNGPRYIVGCRNSIKKESLKQGVRVALDMTTLTIMRILPREVDPLVYNMTTFEPGSLTFGGIGGLNEQIRELREVIELPLKNPELFQRVGINPPKGVFALRPPGTGKTLLAKAVAATIGANFIFSPASAIVDKYIGESARVIREMFGYAKEHAPCIIFMDEVDAIGGRRFSEGTSADREIQRTLMELLNQMDGFDYLGQTKVIMATNRPDTLDPALLRAGRLDRKIEIPLPNEIGRLEIFKIHSANVQKQGEFDYEALVKLSDGFNGADIRNVVTEAGFFAIRDDRDYIVQNDMMKAVRKVAEAKKLEGLVEEPLIIKRTIKPLDQLTNEARSRKIATRIRAVAVFVAAALVMAARDHPWPVLGIAGTVASYVVVAAWVNTTARAAVGAVTWAAGSSTSTVSVSKVGNGSGNGSGHGSSHSHGHGYGHSHEHGVQSSDSRDCGHQHNGFRGTMGSGPSLMCFYCLLRNTHVSDVRHALGRRLVHGHTGRLFSVVSQVHERVRVFAQGSRVHGSWCGDQQEGVRGERKRGRGEGGEGEKGIRKMVIDKFVGHGNKETLQERRGQVRRSRYLGSVYDERKEGPGSRYGYDEGGEGRDLQ